MKYLIKDMAVHNILVVRCVMDIKTS